MEIKTKSEKFVFSKNSQWKMLRNTLEKITTRGFRSLNESEVANFPRLYRMTCADLAEAKMQKLSPDVIFYLNNIIGQAHKYLYSFPPLKKSSLKDFLKNELPMVFIKNWKFMLLSAILFLGTYVLTYFIILKNPGLALQIVPESVLSQLSEGYSQGFNTERGVSMKSMMVSFYIQNNVSIAFACFASGVLLGLGSIYFLLYNGIFIGAIAAHIVNLGHGENFYNFVTAHSVFELTGIVIAGAAGLLLGYTIIKATRYYRIDILRKEKNNIFTTVAASALLIFLAAFIEGYISPSTLPYEIKTFVALLSILVIVLYFFIYPILRLLINLRK